MYAQHAGFYFYPDLMNYDSATGNLLLLRWKRAQRTYEVANETFHKLSYAREGDHC